MKSLDYTKENTSAVRTRSSCFRVNWTCYLCECLQALFYFHWTDSINKQPRERFSENTELEIEKKKIPPIRPFQICHISSSHSAVDNLSCYPASNTVKALSRCLSQRWFPRQQEYDNVAFDMTEGIISLTNRDNRHREGWGRRRLVVVVGGGGGWINGLIFTQREKQQ